ncbi:uncharacterized protein LOC123532094 isoform X2 [Mercenaria mercenaria]|uniref:uncharacterized protein LOC123532094 isoform X2 n=1 Tax=Mercenaria mercenaria TaxID=6596 RepID=UPI00234F6CFD|nr:uncharacterized protein LOC123532094 isoform X2 [Mercenaria mercenaria]
MGNCAGKNARKDSHAMRTDRKKVYQAQDTLVRNLVDAPDGSGTEDAGDADSVGEKEDDKEMFYGEFDWDPDEVFPLLPTDEVERRKGMKKLRTIMSQNYDEVDHKTMTININEYEYPFENLAFEGGGNKGLAYCGAIRVLEEIGAYKNIRRYAGSSAGAMTAALLAVGYNSHEIEEFLSQDLSKIFLDHSCGYFSLLPNLIKGYGWNPGKRIFSWFGEALEAKTGNADITFSEIYDLYGKELCVVVTNLNMMNAEYFHPKTSPDVPVRVAVRMSMSIPGLFQASRYDLHGEENTYVDGGVLCNYPINCYDGWWLSMKMEDSFLNRLQPLENFTKLFEKKERFGTYNESTLGFLLYADNERDILRDILQQRVGVDLPPFPETKLAKEKIRKKKLQEKVKLVHIRNLHAVSAFLKVLKKHNKDNDDKISKAELKDALNDTEEFPKRYVERLFGRNVTVDEAMAALDEDGNGEVYYHEIVHFIERTGVSLQARFLGYQRKEIKGLFSFFDTLQSALLTNVKRIHVEERDIERTVGINTGHVGTSDFKLEQADRDFVVEQGKRSTESFLRYYVVKNDPPQKTSMKACVKSTEQTSEATPGPVNGIAARVQNGTTNGEVQSETDNEIKADINDAVTNAHIELEYIDKDASEVKEDTPLVNKEHDELNDSKRNVSDDFNEHDTSKQQLLPDDKT